MEVEESKINPDNFNLDDLDVCISLFLWPKPQNCEKIRDLKDPNNFNADNYDDGIGAYLKWLKESLPSIKDLVAAKEQHHCLRLQVLAIFKMHDPSHPIFEMLKND